MKEFEHGGNIFQFDKNAKIIDFSANINPYGLSQSVRETIYENIDDIIHYPEPNSTLLRREIAKFYNLAEDQIIVGNGAVEIIYLLCNILQPKNTLIISPTFSEYERAARSVNSKINYVFLDEKLDFNSPMRDIIVKIKGNNLIFLCNPNNPTGTLFTKEDVELLVEHAENNGAYIVVDESFMDFIASKDRFSVLVLVSKYHNLMVLCSMTKFFAIPGLRLGFAAADREVLDPLYLAKDPWNVNSLSQKAGICVLNDKNYIRRSRNFTRTEINYLFEELLQFPEFKVYEPTVNFILVKILSENLTSEILREKLLEKGILIRDASNYPSLNNKYIRFAVRTRCENDILISSLEDIFSKI